jgi:hypothetical protein
MKRAYIIGGYCKGGYWENSDNRWRLTRHYEVEEAGSNY